MGKNNEIERKTQFIVELVKKLVDYIQSSLLSKEYLDYLSNLNALEKGRFNNQLEICKTFAHALSITGTAKGSFKGIGLSGGMTINPFDLVDRKNLLKNNEEIQENEINLLEKAFLSGYIAQGLLKHFAIDSDDIINSNEIVLPVLNLDNTDSAKKLTFDDRKIVDMSKEEKIRCFATEVATKLYFTYALLVQNIDIENYKTKNSNNKIGNDQHINKLLNMLHLVLKENLHNVIKEFYKKDLVDVFLNAYISQQTISVKKGDALISSGRNFKFVTYNPRLRFGLNHIYIKEFHNADKSNKKNDKKYRVQNAKTFSGKFKSFKRMPIIINYILLTTDKDKRHFVYPWGNPYRQKQKDEMAKKIATKKATDVLGIEKVKKAEKIADKIIKERYAACKIEKGINFYPRAIHKQAKEVLKKNILSEVENYPHFRSIKRNFDKYRKAQKEIEKQKQSLRAKIRFSSAAAHHGSPKDNQMGAQSQRINPPSEQQSTIPRSTSADNPTPPGKRPLDESTPKDDQSQQQEATTSNDFTNEEAETSPVTTDQEFEHDDISTDDEISSSGSEISSSGSSDSPRSGHPLSRYRAGLFGRTQQPAQLMPELLAIQGELIKQEAAYKQLKVRGDTLRMQLYGINHQQQTQNEKRLFRKLDQLSRQMRRLEDLVTAQHSGDVEEERTSQNGGDDAAEETTPQNADENQQPDNTVETPYEDGVEVIASTSGTSARM